MSPEAIGYIGISVFLLFLFLGLPIGAAMALVGFVGMGLLAGWGGALGGAETTPFQTINSYDWTVLPVFLLMGALCFYSGMSTDLYWAAYKLLGSVRGGLAMASIAACAGFAAVSGSSVACAVTMGKVALPEMKKYKYDSALATGCIAAGGTMGILIPPSVVLIIYGMLTQESIGKLFIAGVIPGIFEALLYIGTVYVLCRFKPGLGPPGPSTSLREKVTSLKGVWSMLVLFVIVIGGLYGGVFSATEAGGIGACGALVIALARRSLSRQNLWLALTETGRTTGMLFFMLIGAMMLSTFLSLSRAPVQISHFLATLDMNRYIIFALIIFVYLILGCVMDALAMILITVPIFFPVMTALGFNAIWFGIQIVMVYEMAAITPPVGINVFVIKGVAQDVPLYTIFRGIMPFLIGDLCLVVILAAVPEMALFLTHFMK
jgi:C4-dicarboxylate transporter DctM subunit